MRGGVTLWNQGGLSVEAYTNSDGSVTITGDDSDALGNGMDFEYWIDIRTADVPALLTALDGSEAEDPLALLQRHAGDIAPGVRSWLDRAGVPYSFRAI